MKCTNQILRNLRDAGCDEEVIAAYRTMAEQPMPDEAISGQQVHLLIDHRKELLEQLHQDQEKIDCLDHLLYQLKEKAGMLPQGRKTVK